VSNGPKICGFFGGGALESRVDMEILVSSSRVLVTTPEVNTAITRVVVARKVKGEKKDVFAVSYEHSTRTSTIVLGFNTVSTSHRTQMTDYDYSSTGIVVRFLLFFIFYFTFLKSYFFTVECKQSKTKQHFFFPFLFFLPSMVQAAVGQLITGFIHQPIASRL